MARTAAPATNGYDRDLMRSFVDRIDERKAEIASIMGSAMNECKEVRGDIKDIYAEAKDKGIPVNALKAEVVLRELDAEKTRVIAGLEGEDLESLEMIREALGDHASLPTTRD